MRENSIIYVKELVVMLQMYNTVQYVITQNVTWHLYQEQEIIIKLCIHGCFDFSNNLAVKKTEK